MPRGLFAVCHMVRHTANNATFAVCHVDKHTAKNSSFAVWLAMAHGKQRTAKLGRHTGCLPCALFWAHGKAIAVCFIGPTAK